MTDEPAQTRSRKKDHVDIILEKDTQARHNAWDDITLVHEALPDVDLPSIDLRTDLLGARLDAPVMVASMTGGYPDAERLNGQLAEAAAAAGVAMGVGSQRAALLSPEARRSFTVVRDHDVPFVAANIGAPQLVPQAGGKAPLSATQIDELVSMLEADALIVHLNPLQEAIQPEGDLHMHGAAAAIQALAERLSVPVITKETGAGMTAGTARRLLELGVAGLDVGGLSGTTFAAVEAYRARAEGAEDRARLGALYRDWGIPTPVSVLEAARAASQAAATSGAPNAVPVIATGGHRSGLDAARALALGADLAGFASAVLRPADHSAKAAIGFLEQVSLELRTACFLTGVSKAVELRRVPLIIEGRTRAWLEARGDVAATFGTRSAR